MGRQSDDGDRATVQVDRVALDAAVKQSGMTRSAIADAAGVNRSMIGFLLAGRVSTCRAVTGRRIEAALNAPPGSLFGPIDPELLLQWRLTRPRSRRLSDQIDPDQRRRLIKRLRAGDTVKQAATAAGLPYQRVNALAHRDEEVAELLTQARARRTNR